jgi:hypothetical protein
MAVAAWPEASAAAVVPGDARSGPPRSGLSALSSLARARHRLAMVACLVARGVLIVGESGPVGSGACSVDPRHLRRLGRWCCCEAREGGGRGTAASEWRCGPSVAEEWRHGPIVAEERQR